MEQLGCEEDDDVQIDLIKVIEAIQYEIDEFKRDISKKILNYLNASMGSEKQPYDRMH